MDLFGGESSSSPGLQSSTSRLTLQDFSSSPSGASVSVSKRRLEPSAAGASYDPGSPKRVKRHHWSREDVKDKMKTRRPLSLESLQSAISPPALLAWAHDLIQQARAQLHLLSSPDHSAATLDSYHLDLRRAITCLRAIVDESQPLAKADVTLDAIRTLVDVLISDGDLSDERVHQQIKDLLRRGLTAASTNVRYRWFKLAFQELQIRLWMKENDPSSLKLAKSEAKRIANDFPTSTNEPEWAYHFLFLHHKLNTSSSTFARLLNFASQRGDHLVCDAIQVMRLQWSLASGNHKVAVPDYQILDSRDASSWPWALKLYFAILKVAFLSYFSDETGSLEKTKSALKALHQVFEDRLENKPESAFVVHSNIFEVPIAGDKRITMQALPIPHIGALLYILSAAFSGDPTGTRPVRYKFIESGLQTIQEYRQHGFNTASAPGPTFVDQDRLLLYRMEADALLLRSELDLTRSSFATCAESLHACLKIVAHSAPALWDEYKVPYTLMQGMLYQAVDQPDKALRCYTAVLVMQPNHPLALASIAVVRLGRGELIKVTQTPQKTEVSAEPSVIGKEAQWLHMPMERLLSETRSHCESSRVPRLKLISSIIIGVTRSGIVKSKHNLSAALTTANNVGLAHVKPLTLLLLSNLFSNTRKAAAKEMLQSAFKLSIGMGGKRVKDVSKSEGNDGERRELAVGNARTGLKAGRELLKVYLVQEDKEKAEKQKEINKAHESVLKQREADWHLKAVTRPR